MASSRKKQAEGIALLSMYNDDEEEEEEEDEEMQDLHQQSQQQEVHDEENEIEIENENEYYREQNITERDFIGDAMVTDGFANETSPELVADLDPTPPQDIPLRPLTPQQQQQQLPRKEEEKRVVSSERKRSGRGRLTIVDYAHDELAVSPEPEEGEIGEEEVPAVNGAIQEQTPLGSVQVLTPNIQATPQLSEQLEPSQPDELNNTIIESEAVEIEDSNKVPVEKVDPLDKFLPPPPKDKCPEELQKKIDKFLALKKVGRSFNAEVRNRKDYRNPDFLLHAVRYQDIHQIGSCFSLDVFDPYGYDRIDYYDEIEADMRREKERKEQELKKSPKVEFVPAGSQAGMVVAPSKFSIPIPVVAPSALPSAQSAADAVGRDGRLNKKSKWDKVDGDGRNPLPTGGQDSLATAAAHAALLSAANVGAGYSAFVQQKRREAEERRSSERKVERRS